MAAYGKNASQKVKKVMREKNAELWKAAVQGKK